MTDQYKAQKGYLTFAQNNSTTDYLRLAYCQALSIKSLQTQVTSVAVIVDAATKEKLSDLRYPDAFDYVIPLPVDFSEKIDWKLNNEWQAFSLTPFKETVKLESDILLVNNIDHWWRNLQQRDLCLTSRVHDYRGELTDCRAYRRLFDENNLPDVYSGFMYFRRSHLALEFFETARMIYEDWPHYRDHLLKECHDEHPTTDVVYAIAARIVGVERVTNPASSVPTFVHMKGAINGLGVNADWTKHYYTQTNDALAVAINHSRQMYPLHYQVKGYITDELLEKYERAYQRNRECADRSLLGLNPLSSP